MVTEFNSGQVCSISVYFRPFPPIPILPRIIFIPYRPCPGQIVFNRDISYLIRDYHTYCPYCGIIILVAAFSDKYIDFINNSIGNINLIYSYSIHIFASGNRQNNRNKEQ